MILFAGYSFPTNNLCIVCRHVCEGARPFQVAHDHDGIIQVFCEDLSHEVGAASPVGLAHVVDMLAGFHIDLPVIDPGHYATETHDGWVVRRTPP